MRAVLFALCLLSALSATAAEPAVTERGPHHRVWQSVTETETATGKLIRRTNSYTELATGMHYLGKDGQWVESKEEIELFQGGAVARQGQHHVLFEANLNTAGAIDLLAADGKRFRSHILGLAYTDAATGKNTLIATIKDSIGELVAPNQIVYPDAFDGDGVHGDVRLTYTKFGFEQDIILRVNPPSPADYGMNPDTTRLEVWTEFLDPPAPAKEVVVLKQEANPAVRAAMVEPDFTDEVLNFGAMTIGTGSAFPLENNPVLDGDSATVPTGKSWERRQGRDFLIERVEYPAIKHHLEALPQPEAGLNRNKARIKNLASATPVGRDVPIAPPNAPNASSTTTTARSERRALPGPARPFPAAPPGPRGNAKITRTASLPPSTLDPRLSTAAATRPGFVLDYVITSSSSNFTFKGDTTYYVTNAVFLTGTTTFEAGAVIKFSEGLAGYLKIQGPVSCQTTAHRPMICTAEDDDSYGEIISGSNGAPGASTNRYGTRHLWLAGTSTSYEMQHFRSYYGNYGIYVNGGNSAVVSHAIVAYGNYAFANYGILLTLRNALVYQLKQSVFYVGTNQAEHLTAHNVPGLRDNSSKPITLTNCLLIAVTNHVPSTGVNTYTNHNDSGIFQTVGSSAHYLAAGSAHRNAGATAINADLAAALKQRTTYPPLWLTNSITVGTTLYPQAQRDTDTPDLGYHAEPLDYLASGTVISGAALTLTNGVVIGIDSSVTNYGFRLDASATVNSEGTPTLLNRFVRSHAIGELANASGSNPATFTANGSAYSVTARFRFTDFPMQAGGYYHFYAPNTANWNIHSFTAQDCQFRGGNFYTSPNNPSQTIYWLNNLFERVSIDIRPYAAMTFHARNNLFKDGSLVFSTTTPSNNSYSVYANLFDRTAITQSGLTVGNWNNGYVTNCATLSGSDGGDVITNSPAYETSWLGKYYLPSSSPLLNAGSDAASEFGLYHYTVLSSQTKETNSTVDIGWHLVATDGNGNPLDTDGDGIPDYLEDYDGSGGQNGSETDWQSYNSLYGIGSGPGLQVFTPLK